MPNYWFPGGLEHYIARSVLGGATEARFHIVVIEGLAGVVMQPVWASGLEQMLSGLHEGFTDPVDASTRGLYETGWQEIPETAVAANEIYVGVVVTFDESLIGELAALRIGLAEINTR